MELPIPFLNTSWLDKKAPLLVLASFKNPPPSEMLMKILMNNLGLSEAEQIQKIRKYPESESQAQLKKKLKDEFEELNLINPKHI